MSFKLSVLQLFETFSKILFSLRTSSFRGNNSRCRNLRSGITEWEKLKEIISSDVIKRRISKPFSLPTISLIIQISESYSRKFFLVIIYPWFVEPLTRPFNPEYIFPRIRFFSLVSFYDFVIIKTILQWIRQWTPALLSCAGLRNKFGKFKMIYYSQWFENNTISYFYVIERHV